MSAGANQKKAFILNSVSCTRGRRSQDTLTIEKYFNHFNPNNGHFQGKTHSRQIAPTTVLHVLLKKKIKKIFLIFFFRNQDEDSSWTNIQKLKKK